MNTDTHGMVHESASPVHYVLRHHFFVHLIEMPYANRIHATRRAPYRSLLVPQARKPNTGSDLDTRCSVLPFNRPCGAFIAIITTFVASFAVNVPCAVASNDAILSKLGQLKDEQNSKEILSPSASRLSRIQVRGS